MYDYLDWKLLRQAVDKLPLESLASLIYGLWHALSNEGFFVEWYEEVRTLLLNRYRREKYTPYIEEQNSVMRAHFIVPLEESETSEAETLNDGESLHRMALSHIELLAQLFPDCTGYGCQGYGHQIFDFEVPDDSAKNNVVARYLIPLWIIQINKTARILVSHLFRPLTWKSYSTQIFQIRSNTVQCLDVLRKNLSSHFRSKKVVQQLVRLSDTAQWKECSQLVNKVPNLPFEALDNWGYTEEKQKTSPSKKQSSFKEEFIISSYLKRYKPYLQIKDKFFRGLNNFLNQSPHFLVANSFLGKVKGNQERLKFEQTIQELNLQIDKPFLSGFNLAEALKVLPKFQLLYRKHFVNFFDDGKLSELEQREDQTLRALWCLWFYFSSEPARHMAMPGKATLAQLDGRMLAIRKRIDKSLKKASIEELQYCNLGDALQFEDKPALWITVDGVNPLEVYSQLEPLFMLLKKTLGDIKLHSLKYYAIEFQWQNFVIVPLCRGKLLENHVWSIPTYQFISELNQNEGLSNINLVPRKIDQSATTRLGLKRWEPALLKDAKLFFQSAATLQLRLRHMVQIDDFPDLDETGVQIIQDYFDELKKRLSRDLEQVINKAAKLVPLCEQVTEEKHGAFAVECLQLASEQISEIYEKIIPNDLDNGQANLTMDSLKKWQEQVSSIQGDIFMLYLLWCGYIVCQHKPEIKIIT